MITSIGGVMIGGGGVLLLWIWKNLSDPEISEKAVSEEEDVIYVVFCVK